MPNSVPRVFISSIILITMAAKKYFKMPYAGVDISGDEHLLIGENSEYSVIIRLVNPVVRFSASPAAYDEYHALITAVIRLLGDSCILQKHDVISRSAYPDKPAEEYLQKKYNEHFAGRPFSRVLTYLTITRQVKKGAFYTFDVKALSEFRQMVSKVVAVLAAAKTAPVLLNEKEINLFVLQVLGMNFSDGPIALNNLNAVDGEIGMGDLRCRSISLVDVDQIDLPRELGTHAELNDKDSLRGFPVDLLSFLYSVPGYELIIFNQLIEVPVQSTAIRKLERKKKQHSGIPDPANDLCVEDIELLLKDVARENQLLVNCHFNILVCATGQRLPKACNFIESALFNIGILASKSAYNQLELFRSVLPGNAVELKGYDWFLTTCDAAVCFFFKESLPVDEPSDFLIRFTDRQGIPVAIDPADLPMHTGRINNRNKFVLGPSGSGKSFFMNALVEQYCLYNVDVVVVDVGHSYSGLCSYYKGKYITYSEEKPITMNPFLVSEAEYNLEKKDFLITLVALLWKGQDGLLSSVERDVIAQTINAYYRHYYGENLTGQLSFNTFYDFCLQKIPEIQKAEQIPFDMDEFRYVLKKFYKGGEYATILNEAADESLFGERFIVYEIDNLQGNRILLPIVTLIIMDVFIQKMRHRHQHRKVLIMEEAWRALVSPVMAGFLLYLIKTVRKFWGELIPVTQELNDMLGNPILKDSLISSTDTVILLDQTKFKDNYKEIAALLSISETERRKIFTINQLDNKEGRGRFKEVYVRRGAVGEVYGVEVSLAQYLTYTTEKPEKIAVEIYTSAMGSYPDGLDSFIADMDQSGLQLPEFVRQVNRSGRPIF